MVHIKNVAYKRAQCSDSIDPSYGVTRCRDRPILKLHTAAYGKSVEYTTAMVWNSLSPRIRNFPDYKSFKAYTKRELKNLVLSL